MSDVRQPILSGVYLARLCLFSVLMTVSGQQETASEGSVTIGPADLLLGVDPFGHRREGITFLGGPLYKWVSSQIKAYILGSVSHIHDSLWLTQFSQKSEQVLP